VFHLVITVRTNVRSGRVSGNNVGIVDGDLISVPIDVNTTVELYCLINYLYIFASRVSTLSSSRN
jgi:hypothetical protein